MIARARSSKEISTALLDAVRSALARGEPYRSIASSLGLHRSVIDQIATGQHVSDRLGQRATRCRCGHKVILPCRICATRVYLARRRLLEKAPCVS